MMNSHKNNKMTASKNPRFTHVENSRALRLEQTDTYSQIERTGEKKERKSVPQPTSIKEKTSNAVNTHM